MRTSKKKVIVNQIKKKDNVSSELIQTYLFSNASIKLVITYVLFVLAFLLVKDVNKLSFISPHIFFTSTLIFAGIMVLFIIFLCYNKYYKDDFLDQKLAIRLFDIYDLLSFVLMTINILFFIILFILTPTIVDGNSMNNSYYNGDRLLVWHLGYETSRNDAVIIDVSSDKYPALIKSEERFFIKRIVATDGDTITYEPNTNSYYGTLYVNSSVVLENTTETEYMRMITYARTNTSVIDSNNKVLSGYSIVLGDNRNNSTDSRIIGAINNKDIQGKVVFVFYSKNHNFGFAKDNKKN